MPDEITTPKKPLIQRVDIIYSLHIHTGDVNDSSLCKT